MESDSRPLIGEEVREELRPGLTMIKRRTLKEDGRYLIYYEFERDSTADAEPQRAGE